MFKQAESLAQSSFHAQSAWDVEQNQSVKADSRQRKEYLTSLTATSEISEHSNLSKRQLLMWMGHKLHPGVPSYNMMMAFTIEGSLSPANFFDAFQALVDHTDALRMVIKEKDRDGIPQQYVKQYMFCELDYLDFSDMQDMSSEGLLQRWLEQRRVTPFNLEERLFDSALIKVTPERFIWYLNLHHIIIDASSFSLLYRRMADFYDQAQKQRLHKVAPSPSFEAYLEYERTYRRSTQSKLAATYWQKKLAKPIEPTRFYGKVFHQKTKEMARVAYDLGYERSQALREIAKQADVRAITPHLSMFSLFATLLAAYIFRVGENRRNREFALGTPFHNRSAKFKNTIGLLMEICPIKIKLSADDSYLSVLKKMQAETYQVLRYAQHGTTNPIHHKAFDVMMNYHTVSFPDFTGLPTEPTWIHSGYWDGGDSLALQIHDFKESGRFLLHFDFNCDVFEDETQRQQAINHFLRIVDGFIEDRTQQISRVNLLSPEERNLILFELNETEASYPDDQTLTDLFEAQVCRTPDHIAVSYERFDGHPARSHPSTSSGHRTQISNLPCPDGKHVKGSRCRDRFSKGLTDYLTYEELNSKANQVAHYLQALGVGPEVLVGICMDRSLEMMIGILGVLKAGGAYLPLDPSHPAERLCFILQDAGAPHLLTQERFVETFADEGAKLICLDRDWSDIAKYSTENTTNHATSDSLAYLIYTSGSTGRPKGVLIPHRGLVNYLTWSTNAYAVEEGNGAPIHSSIAFDLTITGLFAPLLVGREVELLPQELDVEALGMALQKHKNFSLVKITPAHLDLLKKQLNPAKVARQTKAFVIGGEALFAEHIAFWQTHAPNTTLVNEYGPSETVVGCCVYQIPIGKQKTGPIPIGRPIANTQLYILDQHLQPVPLGVPGELYIGGVGVARGYHNLPALTAERFISNPFSDKPEARLYKTGDLARYLFDTNGAGSGNLEYLGRIDHQVKIRGFRIELGEIEAVLNQHTAVAECVVIPAKKEVNKQSQPENLPGESQRLVAYVVFKAEQQPSAAHLRHFLKKKLPTYMIPAAFMILDTLPLTQNGKINRRALPIPDWNRSDLSGNSFVAATTTQEKQLTKIWANVLGRENIGIYDNFFELGGHSLLAAEAMSQIRQTLDIDVPLTYMFERPTVAELLEVIGG